MLPKQSTGLFRRNSTFEFNMLHVGFDCAPARRVAVLSHEVSALCAEVSPNGDKGSALDSR